jgi:hypothetical protein
MLAGLRMGGSIEALAAVYSKHTRLFLDANERGGGCFSESFRRCPSDSACKAADLLRTAARRRVIGRNTMFIGKKHHFRWGLQGLKCSAAMFPESLKQPLFTSIAQ